MGYGKAGTTDPNPSPSPSPSPSLGPGPSPSPNPNPNPNYGKAGTKGVPPYSDLQYDLELIELSNPKLGKSNKKEL